MPFGIAMAIRFALLPRLRNPWLQLPPFFLGVILSELIMLLGIFLVREYQIVFYLFCAVAMLAYTPHWIRPNRT